MLEEVNIRSLMDLLGESGDPAEQESLLTEVIQSCEFMLGTPLGAVLMHRTLSDARSWRIFLLDGGQIGKSFTTRGETAVCSISGPRLKTRAERLAMYASLFRLLTYLMGIRKIPPEVKNSLIGSEETLRKILTDVT